MNDYIQYKRICKRFHRRHVQGRLYTRYLCQLYRKQSLTALHHLSDPITLEPLRHPLFYNKVTKICYNIKSLYRWMETSNSFVDPVTRQPFSDVELARMDFLVQQYQLARYGHISINSFSAVKAKQWAFKMKWIDAHGEKTVRHINDIHNSQVQGLITMLDHRFVTLLVSFKTLIYNFDLKEIQQIRRNLISQQQQQQELPILDTSIAATNLSTERTLQQILSDEQHEVWSDFVAIEQEIRSMLLDISDEFKNLFMSDNEEALLYVKRVRTQYDAWQTNHKSVWFQSWLFNAFHELVDSICCNGTSATIQQLVHQWALSTCLV